MLLLAGWTHGIAQQPPDWSSIKHDDARLQKFLTELDRDTALTRDRLQTVLIAGYEHFVREDYVLGQAETLLRLGQVYASQSMLSIAIDAFKESLRLFERLKEHRNAAQLYLNLGTTHGRRGDYDEATAYLLDALRQFNELGDQEGIADAHLKLGTVATYLNQHEEALQHFNEALDISIHSIPYNVVTLYGNMAVIYMEQGDYETSERYFLSAIHYEGDALSKRPKALAFLNLGQLYHLQGKQELGDHYLDAAAALAEEGNMLEELVAISLIRTDKSTPASQRRALEELASLYERATVMEMRYMQFEILREMILINKSLGRYQTALELMEAQKGVKDELTNERKEQDIATLRATFAMDRSKQEIQALNDQVEAAARTKRLILGFFIVLTLGLLIIIYYFLKARKANQLLRQSELALSASNQVKDKLFSIIGHDLKNAIGSQPMVIEMLKDAEKGSAEYDTLLEGFEGSVYEVLFVLDTLLNWGKLQIKGVTIRPSRFDVHDLVDEAVRLVQLTAGLKDVQLHNAIPSDTVIFADRDQFQFVVRNLLSNAVKYCHAGDHVTIGVDKNQDDPVFYVVDTGVGMTEQQLANLFDQDRQSMAGTAAEAGHGLALILSKEFIGMHHGRIWAESEPGVGCRFNFTMTAN